MSSHDVNHLEPMFEFKAFDYTFWDNNFDVFLKGKNQHVRGKKMRINVDIEKIMPYMTPIGQIETTFSNGTVIRKMANFKNCDNKKNYYGRLCPDWQGSKLENSLAISEENHIIERKEVKYSFIRC